MNSDYKFDGGPQTAEVISCELEFEAISVWPKVASFLSRRFLSPVLLNQVKDSVGSMLLATPYPYFKPGEAAAVFALPTD